MLPGILFCYINSLTQRPQGAENIIFPMAGHSVP